MNAHAASRRLAVVERLAVLVIGGGFFGASIAAWFGPRFKDGVCLVEASPELMGRASANNQARVHAGYHYPRCLTTAFSSKRSLARFCADWQSAVTVPGRMVYAIARHDTKTTALQFVNFCKAVGAELYSADPRTRALFDRAAIEDVFEVSEPVFDADKLRRCAAANLVDARVVTRLNTTATAIDRASNGFVRVTITSAGSEEVMEAKYVFNCTYANLSKLLSREAMSTFKLKHEVAELCLIDLPPELESLGVTVMDGAFFSALPFPTRQVHSLTHVRYTPHHSWGDGDGVNADDVLHQESRQSNFEWIRRDAMRIMPALDDAAYVGSVYEVKTVLLSNERDDGRPILFVEDPITPGFFAVLGGKIDNVYDVLDHLGTLSWK